MNKLTIIGNLTKDPELRYTQTGKAVCNFTVAVNRRQKDQNGNQITDFFRVSAWSEMGENCQKYLAKGRKVAVVGQVSVSTYTGQDGTTRASLEVLASDVEFLTPKSQEMIERANEAMMPTPAPKIDKQSGLEQTEVDDLPF